MVTGREQDRVCEQPVGAGAGFELQQGYLGGGGGQHGSGEIVGAGDDECGGGGGAGVVTGWEMDRVYDAAGAGAVSIFDDTDCGFAGNGWCGERADAEAGPQFDDSAVFGGREIYLFYCGR